MSSPYPRPPPAKPESKADDDRGTPHGTPALAAAAAAHRPPPTQAAANLARDARAARTPADPAVVNDEAKPPRIGCLQEPETRVSDEGTNLIKDPRAE